MAIAGGFARSVVLNALRQHNPKIVAEQISTICDDIDVFCASEACFDAVLQKFGDREIKAQAQPGKFIANISC